MSSDHKEEELKDGMPSSNGEGMGMSEDVQQAEEPLSSSKLERGIDKLERFRDAREGRFSEGTLRGQRVRSWTEKLILRSATGVIYAVSIVCCLYLGIIPTAIIITAMAWLCCSEFYRMVRRAGRMPNEIWGLTAATAYPLAALLPISDATLLVTAVFLIGCSAWYVLTPRANISDVAVTAFGPIYTSLAFSCLVYIRACDPGFDGFMLTFGVMGSVWLNDSFAYLVGSRIGKNKLAPRISPNKSVEGLWGGIAASVGIWAIIGFLGLEGIKMPFALVTGICVAFFSVVGDLFESRIKRGVGVKDSGDILPGHGGLLDRSDSMLFGGMVAYVLLHLGGIL